MKFLAIVGLLFAVGISTADIGVASYGKLVDHRHFPDNVNTRVVNGNRPGNADFPWMAALHIRYRNDPPQRVTFCGGCIINSNWILTSADCVRNAQSVQINAGSIIFRQPLVSVTGDAYFLHTEYNPTNFANNAALVRINPRTPLNFTNNVNAPLAPIRLAALSQERTTFQGQEAYLSGFGYTAYGSQNMSEYLMFNRKQIISNSDCLTYFNNSQQLIRDTIICAYPQTIRQGPCNGDGGSPLVINEYGDWTLIGVLSFLHGTGSCGRLHVPSVYTRLPSRTFTDWIRRTANYQFRP